MFPDPLFHFGTWAVSVYSLFHLLAVVVFAALALGSDQRFPGSQRSPAIDRVTTLTAILAGAWLGSWLVVALVHGAPLAAGHSSVGALVGGWLMAAWRARREKVDVLRRLDALAPAVAAADATARLGCFSAGCCHGRPAWNLPWGVSFPAESACGFPGLPLHPTQPYLSLAGFALTGLLLRLARRDATRGVMLSIFLVGTGTARLLVEPFRSPPFGNSFTTAGSIAFLAAGTGMVAYLRCRAPRRHEHPRPDSELGGSEAPLPPSGQSSLTLS